MAKKVKQKPPKLSRADKFIRDRIGNSGWNKLNPSIRTSLLKQIKIGVARNLTDDQIYELVERSAYDSTAAVTDPKQELLNIARSGAEGAEAVAEAFQEVGKRENLQDWHPLQASTEPYAPQSRRRQEDWSVERYMQVLSNLYYMSKVETNPDRRRETVIAWTNVRDAKIFHVPSETYIALHQEADRYTAEVVSGFAYNGNPSVKDSLRYSLSLRRAAQLIKYPDRFPFPRVFLGYGQGPQIRADAMRYKSPAKLEKDVVGGTLLGHLVTEEGYITGFFLVELADGNSFFLVDAVHYPGSSWPSTIDLEPWIVPNIIHIINDFRTFSLETIDKETRRAFKDNRKKLGLKNEPIHLPPPFYTLKLDYQIIRQRVRSELNKGRKGPKGFRSDVRGHERCKIARGPLPLEPKVAEKLKQRGYKIFTLEPLDAETHQKLAVRGLAFKRANEWLAVKTVWVAEHQSPKNPELPYIPALRVMKTSR